MAWWRLSASAGLAFDKNVRFLLAPFYWALAILLFLQEWLWDPLKQAVLKLAKIPAFRWLETQMRKAPPYVALLLFALPGLSLLPLKILGLLLIGHSQKLLGFVVFALAKILGTGLLAWIYQNVEPALSRLPWFVWLRDGFVRLKTKAYDVVRSSIAWRTAKVLVRRVRKMVRRT